jgi:hypothetical protein
MDTPTVDAQKDRLPPAGQTVHTLQASQARRLYDSTGPDPIKPHYDQYGPWWGALRRLPNRVSNHALPQTLLVRCKLATSERPWLSVTCERLIWPGVTIPICGSAER